MPRERRRFLRDFDAGDRLDLFFVASVTSVLGIRAYLHLTGYPTIGGTSLHLAHVLWGGLLMLVGIAMFISYLDRAARRLATVVAGVGFGAFIDEVGKFVTHDNDYFYQPSVAIMYVVFVLAYLALRSVHRDRLARPNEYVVNAIRELEEVVVDDLDADERARGLDHLERSGRDDPLTRAVRDALERAKLVEPGPPDRWTHARAALLRTYAGLVDRPSFGAALIAFFVFRLLVSIAFLSILVGAGEARGTPVSSRLLVLPHPGGGELGFIDVAHAGAEGLAAIFVAAGVWLLLRRRRLDALRMFQRSVLVEIFLAQVFAFYNEEWAALIGLALNVVIFSGLRFAIDRERSSLAQRA